MNERITTIQVAAGRWAVIEDSLPIGTIGTDIQGGRATRRTVWIVLDAGQGVDVAAVRGVPYLHPAGAVQAVLDAREAHDRARHVQGLANLERRILDFERAYWAVAVEDRLARAAVLFGLDRGRYLVLVTAMVTSTNPAYREYAPDVIERLAKLAGQQPVRRGEPRHLAPARPAS